MKKGLKIIILLLILAGIGSGVYVWWLDRQAEAGIANGQQSPDKLYTVKRGDLTIGVLLSGSINTQVKHKLSLEVPLPMTTQLVSIVNENTNVRAGDVIGRFETEELQTKIDDLKESIIKQEQDLQIVFEERAILESSNAASIRSARDAVTDAENAYNKFRKLEGPQSKETQEQTLTDAFNALEEAQKKYDDAYDQLYRPNDVAKDDAEEETRKTTFSSAQKALQSATTSYRKAVQNYKIFKRYTYPSNQKSLEDRLEQARLDLRKVMVSTQSSMKQKENSIYSKQMSIRREEKLLEQYLWYMTKMQMVAPADGIVTYGDPDRRWGNTEVKVGMNVGFRNVLVTIPDMNQMVVDTKIPELYRSKVNVGDSVVITPDSIPNLKIKGRVATIASLPVHLIPWDNGSPKVFAQDISFDSKEDERIVSGMSVQIEVVSQVLNNVVFIPIEAVQEQEGKFFVYRNNGGTPETVDVTLGLSNDSFVEITSGLKEDDEVYLYRPFQQDKTE